MEALQVSLATDYSMQTQQQLHMDQAQFGSILPVHMNRKINIKFINESERRLLFLVIRELNLFFFFLPLLLHSVLFVLACNDQDTGTRHKSQVHKEGTHKTPF